MEKQKHMPVLRFPEFSCEWESEKMCEITNYVDYRGKTPEKTESGVFLVTAKNIKMGYIDYEVSKEYISPESYSEVMRRGKPQIGDVLITTEAPLGNIAIIDDVNVALAQRVIKLSGKMDKIYNPFLKHRLISPQFQKKIDEKGSGTTAKGIKGSELHKLKVFFPTLHEQTKIATFLTAVDDRLKQLKRKKTLLERYKKGVMQKIFGQEIRFKDEEGNEFPVWEVKKMIEIGEFKNGINKGKEDFGFGYPFINLMDVFGKSTISDLNLDLVNASEKELKMYELKEGDILFIRSSVKKTGVGETSLVMNDLKDTVYSGFLIRFRDTKIKLDLGFKKYCFSVRKFRENLIALSTTSANTNINQESLNILEISLPSVPEQAKIANFLTAIDDKIKLCSSQIAITEHYKKGLLQQMFV